MTDSRFKKNRLPRDFTTTHWSIVAAAALSETAEAQKALDSLCNSYWYPLYSYLRSKGSSPEESEDLTQGFFAQRIVTRKIFKGVKLDQGRFRTWMLNSLQHFIYNEWDKKRAKKRGGDRKHVSFDLESAEFQYSEEQRSELSPERVFDQAWAMTLLNRSMEILTAQYEQRNKGESFAILRGFLPGAAATQSYSEAAQLLDKSEAAIKMAVSRIRQDYGRILRNEIKCTVSDPSEIQEELRYLLELIGNQSSF